MENKTNVLAIISFVLSVLFLVPFTGIVGFILGIISLNQIKTTNERGSGLAITAVTLGGLAILFWFLAVIGSL